MLKFKKPGDTVSVEIEKDEEKRAIEIPEDFEGALKEFPAALEYFEKLSFTPKKEYVQWITGAKKVETRAARIQKAITMLQENKKLK